MKRRVLCAALLSAPPILLLPSLALAAGDKVEVILSSPQTRVGQGVYVQVVVSAQSRGKLGEPRFPKMEGVEIHEQGTSFQSSMSFGTRQQMNRTVNKTFEYLLIPTRPGKLELAITVAVGGKKLRPKRVPVLQVLGSDEQMVEPTQARVGARPDSAEKEVFLWPMVDKASVYVGEPVIYRFEIWERTNANFQLRAMPSFDDVWVEELEPGDRRTDAVNEVPYRVHPLLERVLFPQKAGNLTIGGGEVTVTPHGGLGLLRPRKRRAPYQVAGAPLIVPIKPLPAEGQPAGFSANNVGRLALQAAVDRTQLKQGEAFTLTVTIEGTGNLRFVDPGEWPELPGMRRYDPKEEVQLTLSGNEVGGTRSYEFLVIAQEAGKLEIPAHRLHYFDPVAEKYLVAKSEPIALSVTPDADAAASVDDEVETKGEQDKGELLGDVFAVDTLPRAEAQAAWLTPARWTTGVLAVPGLYAGAWSGRSAYQRLGGDADSQARAEKLAQRRELIAKAKAAAPSGEGFFAALGELLQVAAVDAAGPAGVGLPRERLLKHLRTEGLAEAEVERLGELLGRCDAARFGADDSDEAARREVLERATKLVSSSAFRLKGPA